MTYISSDNLTKITILGNDVEDILLQQVTFPRYGTESFLPLKSAFPV